MNLQFSGNHGCFAKGSKNGAFIELDNTVLFIDVAAENLDVLEARGLFNHPQLYVLLTHLHPDHVSGLPQLILKTKILYTPAGENKVTILAPEALHKDINELLRIQGCKDKYSISDTASAKELIGIEITPSPTKHSKEILSFGYTLNGTVYYSGDGKEIPPHILNDFLKRTIEALYQDTSGAKESPGHMTLTELCAVIPTDLRHKVTCMHFDTEDIADRCKAEGFSVAIKI